MIVETLLNNPVLFLHHMTSFESNSMNKKWYYDNTDVLSLHLVYSTTVYYIIFIFFHSHIIIATTIYIWWDIKSLRMNKTRRDN